MRRLNESNWSSTGGGGGGYQSVGGGGALQWTAGGGGGYTSNGGGQNPSNVGSNSQSRVVVIHRDERGFGFVVAGDNPVFVQTVREGSYCYVFSMDS